MKKNYLALAVLSLALGACSDNSASSAESTPADTNEVAAVEPEAAVETIEVTADELLAGYKENELAGDQKFKGKTLIVTGKLDSIQSGLGDTPYIMLKAGGDMEFNMPQAHFDKAETDSLVTLKKGETVKIKCIGDGEIAGTPMLADCKVI